MAGKAYDARRPALPAFRMTDQDCSWCRNHDGGVLLQLHIQPGARKGTQCAGLHDGALKLRVAAPPVDGRANEALQRWLAEQLGVPASRVKLVSGASSRRKTLHIAGLDSAQAHARLQPEAE